MLFYYNLGNHVYLLCHLKREMLEKSSCCLLKLYFDGEHLRSSMIKSEIKDDMSEIVHPLTRTQLHRRET
jgi:hypothetical protein